MHSVPIYIISLAPRTNVVIGRLRSTTLRSERNVSSLGILRFRLDYHFIQFPTNIPLIQNSGSFPKLGLWGIKSSGVSIDINPDDRARAKLSSNCRSVPFSEKEQAPSPSRSTKVAASRQRILIAKKGRSRSILCLVEEVR